MRLPKVLVYVLIEGGERVPFVRRQSIGVQHFLDTFLDEYRGVLVGFGRHVFGTVSAAINLSPSLQLNNVAVRWILF